MAMNNQKSIARLEDEMAALVAVADHPNWTHLWAMLNAFASGKSQNEFCRVEPIAVLAQAYAMLAQIDQERKAALALIAK